MMFGSSGSRTHRLAPFAFLLLWTPTSAWSQVLSADAEVGPGTWVVPTIRTAAVREDNALFGVLPNEARFTRMTPSLEVRYQAPLRTFQAGYSLDSDRYWGRLGVLNNSFARQSGVMAIDSRLGPRASVSARARYIRSLHPEDVLDQIGLVQERRKSISLSGELAFDRNITPRLRARGAYTGADDDFGPPSEDRPSAKSTFHAITTGVAYSVSPRSTLGVEYTGRLLFGKDLRVSSIINGRFGASVVAARFTHAMTPRFSVTVLGGARLSQALPLQIPETGSAPLRVVTEPELLASLTYRRGERRASVTYARSQFTGFGAAGFIDTESVEGRLALRLAPRVLLASRPAVYRNSLGTLRALAYRMDVNTSVHAWRWLSAEAGYTYRSQNRSLTLADTSGGSLRPRTRNSISVGVVVQRALRVD